MNPCKTAPPIPDQEPMNLWVMPSEPIAEKVRKEDPSLSN